MLSLETIVILGLLYCFFSYAIWRTQRAKRAIHDKGKISESYLVLND